MSEEAKESLRQLYKDRPLSEETKRKMSISRRGRKAWNNGVKLSDEIRADIHRR